jgi:hypothetical protein
MAEYIEFIEQFNTARKTRVWHVRNKKHGTFIAVVGWYGAWRQYVAEFQPLCVFSAGCLKDIQEFVAKANADHKRAKGEGNG